MFVLLRRAQTWRLHTKLYKFGWHTSANNAWMTNSRDLTFGKIVYIAFSYCIPDFWLYLFDVYDFLVLITWLMKTENSFHTMINSWIIFLKLFAFEWTEQLCITGQQSLQCEWTRTARVGGSWFVSEISGFLPFHQKRAAWPYMQISQVVTSYTQPNFDIDQI